MPSTETRRLETERGETEICVGGGGESPRTVCAAHPAEPLGEGAVELLSSTSGARVVCVNPQGPRLEDMVEEIDAARRELGLDRWVFWGMSGGGWLA